MRNLSEPAAPVGARQAETPRPEPGSAEMSHRRTEMHLRTVDELVTGGMGQADAVWYVETANMVTHKFHGRADFAFQESDPGVKERYRRLDTQAKAIYEGGEGGQVVAFSMEDASTREILRTVDDALGRMRAGVSHYGNGTPKCNQMLAAEGSRIAEAVGPDAQVPVINRISQMVQLPPDDRALVEQALTLSEPKNVRRVA
ncbi:MAG: hypothetical protein UY85_C0011G0023 [Candidatus Peribacteria bacterium GW2011_GWB1_54_5]|nr:MAG: hypothetical protein UY85_C0011G0023 [Candidatus Peribacteria bacterium GW2011_GWB1_54_5]